MDPGQSLPLLPSNGLPTLYQSSDLPAHSGNQIANCLNSNPVVVKSGFRPQNKSSPFLSAVGIRKHATHGAQQTRERGQRGQSDPSLLALDPLITKAELQSERYIAYREKQRQRTKKPEEEPVWTGELEEVFQLALRAIPNLGRKKTPCESQKCGFNGTKPRGRNEHIMHFIKWHTGENRSRKQISSHIQVLKNFLRDTDGWMALVTNPETRELALSAPNAHHSFESQIPLEFTGSNITSTPIGDCPWEVTQQAMPSIDYRSFRSSTSASIASSIYDSPPTLRPSPPHDGYCHSQNHDDHLEDPGHLEYQFLAIPPPPPHFSWQPEVILNSMDQWRGIDRANTQSAQEPRLQCVIYDEETEAIGRPGQIPGDGIRNADINEGRRERRREGFNFWA